jgi:protein-S-isoprenylcysteine O-methyltransferase Ste14
MERFHKSLLRLPPYLLTSIATVLTVAQVVLAFLRHGGSGEAAQWAGWICVWVSGILGILPIIALHRKGGVPKGQSYVKTTRLVDSGIYAVVRHPQGGTAWLLINMGIMLIAWHWTSTVLGLASMALAYADTFKADQYCIGKLGDEYRHYMRKVPRVNLLLGIIRLLRPEGRDLK